jgi:hypothetical protein
MGEKNIKDTRTSGRARNMENENQSGIDNDLDIIADIKKERLEWIGHVVRMD